MTKPGTTPTYPELIITDCSMGDVLGELLDSDTLLITDKHLYPNVPKDQQWVQVTEQYAEHIEQVKNGYKYTKVVGVGGCTALDFARACATGKPLRLLPAILSNACLSTNRSVINYGGAYKTEVTTAPLQTIVSLPEIMKRHASENNTWTAAGFGDLFSAVSASIEVEYEKSGRSLHGISTEQVIANVPDCWEAVQWIASLSPADPLHTPEAYQRLARYLHESSVDVIRNGHTRFNAGSEHELYYVLQQEQLYEKYTSTHGHLVSIGTLLTLAIFGRETGDLTLFTTMRAAHHKLLLPLSYEGTEEIGVKRAHIQHALNTIYEPFSSSLYANYFNNDDYTFVDLVFSGQDPLSGKR